MNYNYVLISESTGIMAILKKTLSGNTAFYKADITRIHLSLYILHTVDPLLKHRILLLSNCNKHGQTRGIKTGF